jgi:hypothetical protein
MRIDRTQARGDDIDFRAPEFAIQRVRLAVDVGHAYFVRVDQGQCANSRARQRLGRPRPDAAEPDHGHMRARQARDTAGAIESIDSGKAPVCHRFFRPLQAITLAPGQRASANRVC